MTDRALLEKAARAAGYDVAWREANIGLWNPLTDDGDALRLAVKLRMDVFTAVNGCYVELGKEQVSEKNFADPYAATRRAIVRAAAAIADATPEGRP